MSQKFKLGLGSPWESSDSEDNGDDELFLLASQQCEEQARRTLLEDSNKCDEDELVLMASQQYEEQAGKNQMEKKAKENVNDYPAMTTNSRFGSPKSTSQVEETRKSGIQVKTRVQNIWASSLWHDWSVHRKSLLPVEEEEQHVLEEDFTTMTVPAMNFWLSKFVLEVRRKDEKPYAPDTIYQICCGLLKEAN